MNSYFIRVELHNAIYPNDYNILHTAMQRAGFVKTITAGNGARYSLPTAEYTLNTTATCQQVHILAKTSSNSTGKTSNILVLQYTAWCGDLVPAR
ncbi:MAG: type V toxin-antitoxin system endoribonuclease antitoxin GhoS [Patescibacteria group bacterium]